MNWKDCLTAEEKKHLDGMPCGLSELGPYNTPEDLELRFSTCLWLFRKGVLSWHPGGGCEKCRNIFIKLAL
jgi:hypothetical protein